MTQLLLDVAQSVRLGGLRMSRERRKGKNQDRTVKKPRKRLSGQFDSVSYSVRSCVSTTGAPSPPGKLIFSSDWNVDCRTFNVMITVAKSTALYTEEVVHRPYEDSVRRHLSQAQGVDAVFIWLDDAGVVHVYSVARDYRDEVYRSLSKKERLVEKECPDVTFEFHLRAHQGRKPSRAVPIGSQVVFDATR